MIRHLILLVFIAGAVILGLGTYLQPDDLGGCGQTPGTDINCRVVDAIVAVSGGDTEARTNQAVSLYKNGWSKTLIFSGAAQDKTGPSNAAAMKTIALSAGVPVSDIFIDEYSETTKQNAENTQTIFIERNIKSVILVTSGYHQRRASLEFNKRANDVNILNHPVLTDKDWSWWWWMKPYGWLLAISEIAKIAVFYVVGIWS
jgi:uncharacterized SAM-binding protein YcdF (DUF218 family)